MASYFTLTLDTTAPSNGSISAPARTGTVNVTLTIGATGADQMKIWGDICATAGGSAIAESDASWVTYDTSASVILTSGDGTKTIYVKFRDDVGNITPAWDANVILDTAGPVVTITGPDVSKISEVSGFDTCAFSFSASEAFVEWKVKVVPSTSSAHTAGTQIPTTGGSTNMSGSTSTAASTPVSCTIKGADLASACSDEDGAKIIKVFVKDAQNNWSV